VASIAASNIVTFTTTEADYYIFDKFTIYLDVNFYFVVKIRKPGPNAWDYYICSSSKTLTMD